MPKPRFHPHSSGLPPIATRPLRRSAPALACAVALVLLTFLPGGTARAAEPAAPARTTGDPAVTMESAGAATAFVPPADFRQLDPWLDYRRHARLPALPEEARIFYRHGLLAAESHASDDALRLVRGAVELDPTLLAARITLLRWQLFSEPSQAMSHAAGIADLARRDFATQWSLLVNAAYLAINAWILALIATALLVFIARNGDLRHAIQERLGRWATPASSHTWAWVLVASPFLLGCGVALPVIAGLGLLWPLLRGRERAIWVLLLASLLALPFAMRALDRLALPMRSDSTLAAVLPLGDEPETPESAAAIARLEAAHPHDPFARFGAGWLALRRGDGAAAEAAYRDVLTAWPEDDTALDNLGTALVQQGRRPEAIAAYERAVAANPGNAVAYFNLAQARLMGYEFDPANRAMARATALDFDRVSEYKNQPARNGALDPVPDWLSPRRQWASLRAPWAAGTLALPPEWRGRPEAASPRFPLLALIVGIVAVALGGLLNRSLPLHHCANCDRVVCRRCAERRKAQAVCAACARVVRGAASANFARILLDRERERSTRVLRGLKLGVALAVPGAGLIAARRVWRAFVLLFLAFSVLTVMPGATWPYAGRARVGMGFDPWCLDLVVPLALVYALSIAGHFSEQAGAARRLAEAARPIRSRPRLSAQVPNDGPSREAA
jgi:tetratricopeptide (TPR) repeat protein